MKHTILALVACAFMVTTAEARDSKGMYEYKEAMETADAKAKLGTDVKFFFGKQAAPAVAKEMGEFTSNKKTNAFNKTDVVACQWAFLSAMLSLRDRAKNMGGDAVINIKSYYKKNLIESNTQFECGAGAMVAGVTLKGTVVKLK